MTTKLEILIHVRKRIIHVEFISLDRQFSISIPKFEYTEWLKLNDLPNTMTTMQKFVDEYTKGKINIDDTTTLLFESIFELLTGLEDVTTKEKTRKITKEFQYIEIENEEDGEIPPAKNAIITKFVKSNQYKLFINGIEVIDPKEIISLYKAVLFSVASAISQAHAN